MSEIVDAVAYLRPPRSSPARPSKSTRGVLLDITDDTAGHYSGCKGRGGYGPINVLISNASCGLEITVKESSMNDLHRQLDVNFFGRDAITKAVQRSRIWKGGAAGTFPRWTPITHQRTSCWAPTRCT